MPAYDYKCTKCENIQEERHGMSEKPRIKCVKCGGKCQKAITTRYYYNMGDNKGSHPDEVPF
jgi:putative FmdB family regulatory protein